MFFTLYWPILLIEAWIGIYPGSGQVIYPVILLSVRREGVGRFFTLQLKVDNRGESCLVSGGPPMASKGISGPWRQIYWIFRSRDQKILKKSLNLTVLGMIPYIIPYT